MLRARNVILLPDHLCAWVELNRHMYRMSSNSLMHRLQHDIPLLPLVSDTVFLKNRIDFAKLGKLANRDKSVHISHELQLNIVVVVFVSKVEGDLRHKLLLDIAEEFAVLRIFLVPGCRRPFVLRWRLLLFVLFCPLLTES